MKVCANCLKSKSEEYKFCPWCGHPGEDEAGALPEDKTVLEDDTLDKTVLEGFSERTRLDAAGEIPPFFAWVVFLDDEGLPFHYLRLPKEKSIIGKGDDADVRVADDFASKLHALIYRENDDFYISDLGSTNGTFVNEQKVMKEALKDGDRFRVGRQPMIFKRLVKC